MRTTQLVPAVEVTELHAQHGCLKRVEPLVRPDHDVLVLPPLAEIAQQPDLVGELLVVGRDGARVAVGAEILARIEAERGDPAERPATTPLVARTVSLAGILDEGETLLVADRLQRIGVERVAEEVDSDDRLRAVGDGPCDLVDVDLGGPGSQSTSTGVAPSRSTGRIEAMNVFAGAITSSPGPISERLERELDRRGAGCDADAVARRRSTRPTPPRSAPTSSPRMYCVDATASRTALVDLVLDRGVLALQIDEGYYSFRSDVGHPRTIDPTGATSRDRAVPSETWRISPPSTTAGT